eukprot:TRINITY_DN11213_c0_g1_i1.p1 TRINITY_DN11213_c0_g1~~TRINITY_DN11213_c0_g1_i1.p1  ORF type:complete len:464 (+),score=170.82 TRINITY_DN11213_c0_g1_i1:146-1537(+)
METRLKATIDSVQEINVKLGKAKTDLREMQEREIEANRKYSDLMEEHKNLQKMYNKARDDLIEERKKKRPVVEESKKEDSPAIGLELDKLKKDNANLMKEITALKRARPGADLLDEEGILRSKTSFNFQNADEIYAAIRNWIRLNPGTDLMGEFRAIRPVPKAGMVSKEAFQQLLAQSGVTMREYDFNLLVQSLNKDRQNNLDFFDFYSKMRNLKESGAQAKIEEVKEISSATVRRDFALRPPSRKAEPESKKIELLQLELLEVKREYAEISKQLKEWKEKALKLKKENDAMNNKPLKREDKDPRSRAPIQEAPVAQSNLGPDMEARLRSDIMRLDQENERLRRIIEVDKEMELKAIKEENQRLAAEMKVIRAESLKTMSTLDTLSRSPMGIKLEEIDTEKDKIIKNLKNKLDSARERESDLTTKIYELEKANKDLRFVNENQLIKMERLTKRVTELEQQRLR